MADDKRTLLQGFVLDGWQVRPLKREVLAPDGTTRHVAPKAMEVLVCLAQRAGDVVERQDIFDDVWGQQAHTEEALTHCIGELRQVFDDKADDPQFFQTLPRRGYRLVAEVTRDGVEEQSTVSSARSGGPRGFFARQMEDLRNRNVIQIVVGYPVLAWLLVQVVDVVWEYLLAPLGAPAWLVPSFVVLLALGYPIAVFLSWAIDITPEGMRLSERKSGATPIWGLAIVGIASVAITVAGVFAYFNTYDVPEEAEPAVEIVELPDTRVEGSIAVLRFINISQNPAIDYLGDGLTEELIHELTNLGSVKVAARTSVWPLSSTDMDITEIADRLSVEKVLEGSVRSDGDQVRITAQLIDFEGFHLWSEVYDRSFEDVLAIQRDIATQVASELNVLLSDDSKARLTRKPTVSTTAYNQYLKGRQILRQPGEIDALNAAQALFEEAIELDPRFSLAYAGLCETHLAVYRYTRSVEIFEQAEIACHRALTLDGGLAEVYTALGNLYRHSGQYIKAEQEYLVALGINPMLEEANFGLGRAYQGQGRLAEAETTLRRSIEMEPGYWGAYLGLGNFLNRNGRYADSVPYYEKVTELAPDYAGGFINLGSSLHWLGEWDKAEAALLKSLELETDALAYMNIGTLYYYQQRFSDAIEMHEQAVLTSSTDHRTWGKLAAAQRYVEGFEAASIDSYTRAIELVREQLAVNPDEPDDLALLGVYLANTQDLAGSSVAIEQSLSLAPTNPSTHYFKAILEMNAGNHEKALAELEIAANFGYSLKLLAADPELERLRGYAGFATLTRTTSD
jgi:TolB-like protein/DNA-binding winged helix-turn-helix (wHTH) protein/Flp pilus assembly protein TadD